MGNLFIIIKYARIYSNLNAGITACITSTIGYVLATAGRSHLKKD